MLWLTTACQSGSSAEPRHRSEQALSAGEGTYLRQSGLLIRAVAELSERAGNPVFALRLTIDTRRVLLQAQDPIHPLRVRQFEYRDGEVFGPVPVRLEGEGHLEDNLFPLGELSAAAIPDLAARAANRVDPHNGKVSRVVARRNLPYSADVRLRVYVTSPILDGQVDADAQGRLLDGCCKG
ncbi:MAG: hypothetical protein JW940_33515 [Polyangiaceae bacterium]|nr:hypothetical protein [Polyangiaceae bacterium]